MSKGTRRERDAVELFQTAGYEAYTPPKAKFREQDVFGLYDVLAYAHGTLYGVQVRSRASGITEWFCSAGVHESGLTDFSAAYMVYHDDESAWRFAESDGDSYAWVVDERDRDCAMGERVVEWLRGETHGDV